MLEVSWADGSPLLWILEELSRALHVPPLSSAEGSPVLPAVQLWYTHWKILSTHHGALRTALSP